MTDEWAEAAATWDDEPTVRAYSAAAYDSLIGVLDSCGTSLDGARVCDFGCGTGLLTERLVRAGASVDAVDVSPAMLAVLDRKIASGSLERVTTSPEATGNDYDLVVCSSVLSFVVDLTATVSDLVDRLLPGGVFVQWDWERDPSDADGHGLGRAEIRTALEAAGLTDVTVETGFSVAVDGGVMSPLIGFGRTV